LSKILYVARIVPPSAKHIGLPIVRISVFCSLILDPDTCPKFLNSLIRSSYSEISVLIIEQSSACWKSFVFLCVFGICIYSKIQFENWKDRRLSLRHKVLIINTYILSKILYVARIVPPSAKHIGLPIVRISVFCSLILDPDTCPKFLNSLHRSSYSEIYVLIIEQLSAC
jgi:hypothetical protein